MRSLPKSTRIMFTPSSDNQVDYSSLLNGRRLSFFTYLNIQIILSSVQVGTPKPAGKKMLCSLCKKVFLNRWGFPFQTFIHSSVTCVAIDFRPGRRLRTTPLVCMAKKRLLSCQRGLILRLVETDFSEIIAIVFILLWKGFYFVFLVCCENCPSWIGEMFDLPAEDPQVCHKNISNLISNVIQALLQNIFDQW